MTYGKAPKKPSSKSKAKMKTKMGAIAAQLGGIPGRNGMSPNSYRPKNNKK